MKPGRRVVAAATGLAVLGAAVGFACGGSSGTPAAAGEAGGEAGGEAALVSVTDPATKLAFKHPASWTRTSEGPLTFTGQDEYVAGRLFEGGQNTAGGSHTGIAIRNHRIGPHTYCRITLPD